MNDDSHPDYQDEDGDWMCGEHDVLIDYRYGCRYCPKGA